MQNVIHRPIDLDRLRDIVLDELECSILEQVCDIAGIACEHVIHAQDLVAVREKSLTEMRPDESAAARDERSHVTPPPLTEADRSRSAICRTPAQVSSATKQYSRHDATGN
jgi:hypothetical protein